MVAVAPPTIKLYCPSCRRYLGETNAPKGTTVTMQCKGCNKWRPVKVGT